MKSFVVICALVALAVADKAAQNADSARGKRWADEWSSSGISSGWDSGLSGGLVEAPTLVAVKKVVHVPKIVEVPQVIKVRKVVSVPELITVKKVVSSGWDSGSSGYSGASAGWW